MIIKSKQHSATEIGELDPWKRQESTFCILHLIVLAVLLLVHTLFTAHFGVPSRPLVAVLAGAFLLRVLQLVWIQGLVSMPTSRWLLSMTTASVVLNLALAFVAAILTDRSDSQYFVLLVMPVVEAAFRFRSDGDGWGHPGGRHVELPLDRPLRANAWLRSAQRIFRGGNDFLDICLRGHPGLDTCQQPPRK